MTYHIDFIYFVILLGLVLRIIVAISEFKMGEITFLQLFLNTLVNFSIMLAFTVLYLAIELHAYAPSYTVTLLLRWLWGVMGVSLVLQDGITLYRNYKFTFRR